MRYLAFATDYDGTLATQGKVQPQVLEALKNVAASGRKLVLVTGRELEDLFRVFPEYDIFDRIVAENGALLYRPATKEELVLTDPPSEALVEMLRKKHVKPLSSGRAIIATWEPHEVAVLESIKELGLELQVIFNKGAVMILPTGVNKSSGLKAALLELGLTARSVIGAGDAENDHAFLSECEFSVAVANAIDALKEKASLVTKNERGAGVIEVIQALLETDLAEFDPPNRQIVIGANQQGKEVGLSAYGSGLLIAGQSGGGKSKTTLGILENIVKGGYQFCLVDPEGDYDGFANAVAIGDAQHPPSVDEVCQLLNNPTTSTIVNLLGYSIEDRPHFFVSLLPRLIEMRATVGRPHWIVLDEAHHLMSAEWKKARDMVPPDLGSIALITVHPDRISPDILPSVDVLIAVGDKVEETVAQLARGLDKSVPQLPATRPEKGQGWLWLPGSNKKVMLIDLVRADIDRRRHRRKYAEGQLPPDCSFYFRGPQKKLNLRVHNLMLFNQIAEGVDDDTWNYHLKRHDYSKWFKEQIKDDDLVKQAKLIEDESGLSPKQSRAAMRSVIEDLYTAPP
jgi:HAD superfamily hydrolase (TIGR01484 family)